MAARFLASTSLLLLAVLSPLVSAQLYPWIPPDSFDTLYLPQNYTAKAIQTGLLADLGGDLEGIKLLIKYGSTLGSGFVNLTTPPANLTTDPGLSYLATATQAYLALSGSIGVVAGTDIVIWETLTNTWFHAAASYVPGAVLFGNGGTFYSLLYFTLKDGPVLITTPPFTGLNRWTIYFEDIYGNAFNVLGSDHGNNVGGSYLIVPPGWSGLPAAGPNFQIIQAPTIEGQLLGRSYYAPNASAIAAFDLSWTGGLYQSSVVSVPLQLWPLAYPEAYESTYDYTIPSDPLLFWRGVLISPSQESQVMGLDLNCCPVNALIRLAPSVYSVLLVADEVVGEVFRRNGAHHIVDPLLSLLPSIGLYQEFGFVETSLTPLILAALQLAPYYANRILIARSVYIGPPELNYWQYPATNGKFGSDYVSLAAIQKTFFIANEPQDAVYYYQYLDVNAQPLDGRTTNYTITFSAPPPTLPYSFYSLVANDLENFVNPPSVPTSASIAVGFYTAPDGTIPFRLSSTLPPANSTATQNGWNFVQLPPAKFYLILRVYAPQQSVLSNTYAPPAVVPVTSSGSPSAPSRRSTRRLS